jgi:hypothetical protein
VTHGYTCAAHLEEIEALEPDYLGPTWQKDAFDRWKLPESEFMLGWQIAGWCEVDRLDRHQVETLLRLFEAHRSSRCSMAVELATP